MDPIGTYADKVIQVWRYWHTEGKTMGIRLKTVREMATKLGNRTALRARWRMKEQDPETLAWVTDSDGEERDPSTWRRWRAEYFLSARSLERQHNEEVRVRWVYDRDMTWRQLWADYCRIPLMEFGRLTILGPVIEENPARRRRGQASPTKVAYVVPADMDRKRAGERITELERVWNAGLMTGAEEGEFEALIKWLSVSHP
jgi:hypothetical protein